MSGVGRVVGIETEYGILEPPDPRANPIEISTALVRAYAAQVPHTLWDYAGEDPLHDARGFHLERASAHPSLLTDDPTLAAGSRTERAQLRGGAANAVLTNGARLYVDHAHPEYSSPEVFGPLAAVTYDKAGDEIARRAVEAAARLGRNLAVYKNNVDGKGSSYGTHENYLVSRQVAFSDLAHYLTPFFVTRPLLCGAGRVGIGQRSEEAGFQISQRADYVENDIGLETTFNRPIVNTRDEPHAAPSKYRRLHVIGGDANQFETATYLKFATTSLVLSLLESGAIPLSFDALSLSSPVVDTWAVSHHPFEHVLSTQGRRSLSALDIQRIYLDTVWAHFEREGADEETWYAIRLWDEVLRGLATDPNSVADRVEWVAKKLVLKGLRARSGSGWADPKLAAADIQWADLRRERSIVARLEAAGKVARLVAPLAVARAVTQPPADTRAYFRGTAVARFGQGVAAASWSSVVVDSARRDCLVRIPLVDPHHGTEERTATIFEAANVDELIEALQSPAAH